MNSFKSWLLWITSTLYMLNCFKDKIHKCFYISSIVKQYQLKRNLPLWKTYTQWLISLRPSDAIWCHRWRHRSWSTLIQIMACCLFSMRSLREPTLSYCQFDLQEPILVKSDLNIDYLQNEANASPMLSTKGQPVILFNVLRGESCLLMTRWCKEFVHQNELIMA